MIWILLALLALICVFLFHTNTAISVMSLGFAAFSFMKMNNIEERKLQIEEERRSEEKAAYLTAHFILSQGRRLRIENNGKGEARNIKVLLDGQPLDEQHPLWWKKQPRMSTKLGSHEFRDYVLRLPASQVPKTAEIHWDDDEMKGKVNGCPLPLA